MGSDTWRSPCRIWRLRSIFIQRVGHLRVTERGKKTAFLSGGSEHHWLRLDEGDASGLARIAFELTGKAAIDEVVNRLDARGVAWKAIDDLPGDRVVDAIRFCDPDGFEIELFAAPVSLSVPVETFVKMDRLLHAVWLVDDPVESAQFYCDVLGFKESDWIERIAVFMRSANRYHHSAGILRGGDAAGQLDHFCILVEDLDDVMPRQECRFEQRSRVSARSSAPCSIRFRQYVFERPYFRDCSRVLRVALPDR